MTKLPDLTVHMKRILPWLVWCARCVGTRAFFPALAAIVSQLKNIFSLTAHFFPSFVPKPHCTQTLFWTNSSVRSLKVNSNEKWGGSEWRQLFGYSLALWRSRVISSLNVPFLCTTHSFCFRLLQLYRRIGDAHQFLANRTRPVSYCVFKIWTFTTPIVLAGTCLYLE